jgi:hypothetical protein
MLHRKARRAATGELDSYRLLAESVLAQAGTDLAEPRYALDAARFFTRLDPDRNVWSAWIGVHSRSIRPEVLVAIEKVLAGRAKVVPRKLLRPISTPAEEPDLLDV